MYICAYMFIYIYRELETYLSSYMDFGYFVMAWYAYNVPTPYVRMVIKFELG